MSIHLTLAASISTAYFAKLARGRQSDHDPTISSARADGVPKPRKSAQVVGDVWYDSLSIEVGALLEGHLKRNGSAAAKEAAKPKAQAKPPENTAQADTSATG